MRHKLIRYRRLTNQHSNISFRLFKNKNTNNDDNIINLLITLFLSSASNYRFLFNNNYYIYNDRLLVKYKTNHYNTIIKFNYLENKDIKLIIENDASLVIDKNFLINNNIHEIVQNIISWQFGMYQNEFPKPITSTIGFWSKRECNFFNKYTGTANAYFNSDNGIQYNYGSLQDGTGIYIKLIVDYYLKYKSSSLKNDCFISINIFIDYLNEMIYENGGIPQYYPLQGGTFDNICLNDGAFVNYFRCCDFILHSNIIYEIDNNKILLLRKNYVRALQCILDLQITINNTKTIWAQQYDNITLKPTQARNFEQKSLCSLESAQLLVYLMTIPNPSLNIKSAIISGCKWFSMHAIHDYIQYKNDKGIITISKKDNPSRKLYSRYYSLINQTPVFFDRNNTVYTLDSFNNLPIERRNNYTWLGTWGHYLLKTYSIWVSAHTHKKSII